MASIKTFLSHNKKFHEQMLDMANEKNLDFYTKTLRDVFILGLVYAIKESLKLTDLKEGQRQNSIRIPEVINDDHRFLFRVIAYSRTKDYRVLGDEKQFYELAEKFANTGVKEIVDKYYKTEYPAFKLAEIALKD